MHWPGGPNCSRPWAVRQENGNRCSRRTFCSHRPCEYRKQHAARAKCENRLKPASCTMHMPQCKTRQQNQPRQALKQDSQSTKNGQGREPCRRTAQTNGVTMLIITPCAHVKALRPVPPAERALWAATAARACARLAAAQMAVGGGTRVKPAAGRGSTAGGASHSVNW